jgi:nucleoside-diphosphate-sugar epimerase
MLSKDHTVYAFDNLNNGYLENLKENGESFCEFIQGDIRDTDHVRILLKCYNIDIVIHLAALTSLPECESRPTECIDVNVAGTVSVLDAIRNHRGQKVIIASTSAIYENNSYGDFDENSNVRPRLFYPLSKYLMEETIKSYIKNYEMDIVTLRFFNVFGPQQDIYRKSPPLINYIVRQIKNNKEPIFYSDGNQTRDYVHVNDVVNLIKICIENPKADREIFNVCTGTQTSVRDILRYAEEAFGREIPHFFEPPSKFWGSYESLHSGPKPLSIKTIEREVLKWTNGSYKKAHSMLGWTPNLNIRALMIDTMKQNYDLFNNQNSVK